jgi:hypothetical protein
MKLNGPESERGAAALFVALCLVLLLGMAAFAIDYGFGLNERRVDVAAADIGVMAGAVESLGTTADIRDQILSFTRLNLSTVYTNAEWQTLWQGCQDTELAGLNTSGFTFIPVAPPAGWTVQSPWCISTDPAGFVRVRLPDQIVETHFGRVLGVQELATNADAIARLAPRGGGGILPFGLLATASDGTHVCLRDPAGGHAQEPCDGPDAGNFGALEAPLYPLNCNGAPKPEVLAINIALGIDHRVVPDADGSPGNELLDQCSVINAGQTPDTLNTFQGLSGGTQEGLATGGSPLPTGLEPRLQQGNNPTRNVYGYPLDDVPLWQYIDPSLVGVGAGGTIPNSCVRSTFANGSNPDFDWDGDGTLDRPGSFQHMSSCLVAHAAANGPVLFLETLKESPRFSYVPQFWESDFPNGNSAWRHILRFKATWLQATWWKKGNTITMFNPGEAGSFSGGNASLEQLSGILIPDGALPADLRGTPGPSGGLDPYIPELFR